MRSFDFYDTLVSRLVGDPADIFSLVGERLNIPDFRSMRIAAEIKARLMLGGEITYKQIYDFVSLSLDMKERAFLLELEFEHSLVAPVTAVLSQFRTGDLIVSDMYHDESLYRAVLERLVPGVVPGAVLVSGALGVNKATGGLWKKVATEYPTHEFHLGDNIFADVYQARRNGLVADHFVGSELNRYELTMAQHGGDDSIIAGASRATRLSLIRLDSLEDEVATIDAFASVIGPLILAFVHWVMRACETEGIRDVYFLARDGQLPFKLCSRLVAESGQELYCHYIYGSRQALHLPGCKTIDDASIWLFENPAHLTLRKIAERTCIPLDVVMETARPYMAVGSEDVIRKEELQLLDRVIHSPCFVAAFMASVNRAFEPAMAYYHAQGLASKRKFALVDIGWNGRLQRSLGALLEKSGHRPDRVLGLYLCLSRRPSANPWDELRGFVADPERSDLATFFDMYRGVCEAALSADHPRTIRFELIEGTPQPVFGELYPDGTKRRIALQHTVLAEFTEHIVALSRAASRLIAPSPVLAVDNFMKFLRHPRRSDGLAFQGFLIDGDQTGYEMSPIIRFIRASDLLMRRRELGCWPEGSLSASGYRVAAFFRRIWQGLRRKFSIHSMFSHKAGWGG